MRIQPISQDDLYNMYWNKMMSTGDIGKHVGVHQVTVLNWMKKHNISRRTNSEANSGKLNKHKGKSGKRKYKINESFFDNHSPQMFWCLGFVAADGCIERNSTYSVCQKQMEVIQKFKKIIGYSKNIERKINNYGKRYYRLRIDCVHHVKVITSFGISKRKSLTLKFPNIPDEYFWHFVRGYFDGDGSICLVKGKPVVSFVGSVSFMEGLSAAIHCKLNIPTKELDRYYTNTPKLVYCGVKARAVADQMYEHSEEIRLNRKFNRYCKYWKVAV